MKRIICVSLAAVTLLLSLCACAKIVKMEYNETGELVAADGTVYKYAPSGYEPTSQGKQYGLIKGTLEEKLYVIDNVDPLQWVTTEYADSATTVFYNASITLPDLKAFAPSVGYVCQQDSVVYSIYTLGDKNNKDQKAEKEVIDTIVTMLTDDAYENVLFVNTNSSDSYDIKLYSEKWPAIYYNLEYYKSGNDGYVYDMVTRKRVCVGDLLDPYIGVNEDNK